MVRIYSYPDDVLLLSCLLQGSNDWSKTYTLWAKEDLDKVKCCSYTVVVDVLEPSTKRDVFAALDKFIMLPEP